MKIINVSSLWLLSVVIVVSNVQAQDGKTVLSDQTLHLQESGIEVTAAPSAGHDVTRDTPISVSSQAGGCGCQHGFPDEEGCYGKCAETCGTISGHHGLCHQCGESFQEIDQCDGVARGNCFCGRLRQNLKPDDLDYFQYYPGPPCPGVRLNRILDAQKTNGRLAQLVFYKFHFQFDVDSQQWTLTQSGINQAYNIARIWHKTPGPVVIDTLGSPETDHLREMLVRDTFLKIGFSQPVEIRIGDVLAPGLTGIEAETIFAKRNRSFSSTPVDLNSSSRRFSPNMQPRGSAR